MNKILDVDNVSAGYDNNPRIIKNISFSVYQKDFLGIIGPNGGGKTTLLRTQNSLQFSSGKITHLLINQIIRLKHPQIL